MGLVYSNIFIIRCITEHGYLEIGRDCHYALDHNGVLETTSQGIV